MFSPIIMDNAIPTHADFRMLMQALVTEKSSKRRVRFAPFVMAASAGPLAFHEVKDLWYAQSDLADFKSQARKVASDIRNNRLEQQQDDDHIYTRGLEHCTPQRQKHRCLTIRCILSANRKGMSPDQISLVASKCTAWNGEVAFIQACHDYANVYQPSMTGLIPSATSSPPDFPFLVKKKRCVDEESSSRRVVRRRIVQPMQ
jgi:hypothetical protein